MSSFLLSISSIKNLFLQSNSLCTETTPFVQHASPGSIGSRHPPQSLLMDKLHIISTLQNDLRCDISRRQPGLPAQLPELRFSGCIKPDVTGKPFFDLVRDNFYRFHLTTPFCAVIMTIDVFYLRRSATGTRGAAFLLSWSNSQPFSIRITAHVSMSSLANTPQWSSDPQVSTTPLPM